jgi:CYTH domain-containing protein
MPLKDSFLKPIKQGYLSSVAERTVRVRIKGDKGYITVKGSNETGMSRFEWEKRYLLKKPKNYCYFVKRSSTKSGLKSK